MVAEIEEGSNADLFRRVKACEERLEDLRKDLNGLACDIVALAKGLDMLSDLLKKTREIVPESSIIVPKGTLN
jgi:hypothetical protein